jgi:hypothetical protein
MFVHFSSPSWGVNCKRFWTYYKAIPVPRLQTSDFPQFAILAEGLHFGKEGSK